MFLLDTDTCIDILRGLSSVVRKIAQLSPDDCAISSITVFELYSGALLSAHPHAEQLKVDRFVDPLTIITFDSAAGREAARLRADLKRIGSSIGPYDLLIAAEAIRSGLTLISSNLSEFRRIRSLQVETWRA
jgi:tRNA(fMet)-specific endonuclease VapC